MARGKISKALQGASQDVQGSAVKTYDNFGFIGPVKRPSLLSTNEPTIVMETIAGDGSVTNLTLPSAFNDTVGSTANDASTVGGLKRQTVPDFSLESLMIGQPEQLDLASVFVDKANMTIASSNPDLSSGLDTRYLGATALSDERLSATIVVFGGFPKLPVVYSGAKGESSTLQAGFAAGTNDHFSGETKITDVIDFAANVCRGFIDGPTRSIVGTAYGGAGATATFGGDGVNMENNNGTTLTLTHADGTTVTFTTDNTKAETASTATLIGTDYSSATNIVATRSFHVAFTAAIAAGTLKMTLTPVVWSSRTTITLTQNTVGIAGDKVITNPANMYVNGNLKTSAGSTESFSGGIEGDGTMPLTATGSFYALDIENSAFVDAQQKTLIYAGLADSTIVSSFPLIQTGSINSNALLPNERFATGGFTYEHSQFGPDSKGTDSVTFGGWMK